MTALIPTRHDAPGSHSARKLSSCLHCGQPVASAAQPAFCCAGCARVHDLLVESGLDRYYTLCGSAPLSPVALATQEPSRPWLEALEASQDASAPLRHFTLDVQGIQCGACAWLIEALFQRMPDAYSANLNPALGRLHLTVGPAFCLSELVHNVEQFGYLLGPKAKRAEGSQTLLLRTAVCSALAGNTMFLSAALYLGLSEGPLHTLVQQATFALGSLCALVGGSYFVQRAYRSLRRGVLHLDLPIALGMGLAYLGSVWSFFFDDSRASYFDTVAVFVALMLVGRLFSERLVEKNRRQLLSSDGDSGLLTRRVVDQRPELLACAEVRANDALLICPGELVPVTAALESARADCSLAWINGESEPLSFGRGDTLVAGAINVGDAAFAVRAREDFVRSSLETLLRGGERLSGQRRGDFWDRLSRVYVSLVLGATALGAAGYALAGAGVSRVIDVSVAVLVVTCPCAFGIAAPLASELGIAALRRAGLFVRTSDFFERAARISRVVFDKTGTLTSGALRLREPETLSSLSPESRRILFDLASRSNHPKSAAIAQALRDAYPAVSLSERVTRECRGRGVELSEAGVTFRLGAPGWALKSPGKQEGPVFSAGGVALLDLPSEEVVRSDAENELRQLKRDGLELWIASGDRQARVDLLADRLGLGRARARGDLTPEAKQALVQSLDEGDTLMLGDGINDGPALERAYCSGTPAIDKPFVPARTDFYFLTPGLGPVRMALLTARRVRRVVRHVLTFFAVYNLGAVALCYAGLMRPWLAALLMPASSLVVLSYTALSLSWSKPWKS